MTFWDMCTPVEYAFRALIAYLQSRLTHTPAKAPKRPGKTLHSRQDEMLCHQRFRVLSAEAVHNMFLQTTLNHVFSAMRCFLTSLFEIPY